MVRIPDVAELMLFDGCTRGELARIRSLVTAVLLPAGETVIESGDRPRQFAIIADGEVVVEDAGGDELAVLGPGTIVGELSLLRREPAGASVRTLTPVILYVGNRWEFQTMLEIAPSVDHQVLHLALDRLRPTRRAS